MEENRCSEKIKEERNQEKVSSPLTALCGFEEVKTKYKHFLGFKDVRHIHLSNLKKKNHLNIKKCLHIANDNLCVYW